MQKGRTNVAFVTIDQYRCSVDIFGIFCPEYALCEKMNLGQNPLFEQIIAVSGQ